MSEEENTTKETEVEKAEEVEAPESLTPEDEDDGNAKHKTPLFTGDLGGAVLLDSTPGTPGAANAAAVVAKTLG